MPDLDLPTSSSPRGQEPALIAARRRVPAQNPSRSVGEIWPCTARRGLSRYADVNGPPVKEWQAKIERTRVGTADIAEGREGGIAAEQRLGIENAKHEERRRHAVVAGVGYGEIRRSGWAIEPNGRGASGERGGA